MNAPIDLDRKVHFKLNYIVSARVVSRIEKFLLDGATGSVQLNIRDGDIQTVHINEVVIACPKMKRYQTAH